MRATICFARTEHLSQSQLTSANRERHGIDKRKLDDGIAYAIAVNGKPRTRERKWKAEDRQHTKAESKQT